MRSYYNYLFLVVKIRCQRNLFSGFFCVLFLALSSTFCFAVDDSCFNSDQWSVNRESKSFDSGNWIPDRWPLHKLSLLEAVTGTYYTQDELAFEVEERAVCATYNCPGIDQATFSANPSISSNPSLCTCTATPAQLCGDLRILGINNGSIISDPSGGRMPDFPEATYPEEWDTEFYYKGVWNGTDQEFRDYALSKIEPVLKDTQTFISKCDGIEITGTGDSIAEIHRYVIHAVKRLEQRFEVWYRPFERTVDYGVCGVQRWHWSEGLHLDVWNQQKRVVIPVEAIFAVETQDVLVATEFGCSPGMTDNGNGTCIHSYPIGGPPCPDGYTFKFGNFGASRCQNLALPYHEYCVNGVLTTDPNGNPTCLIAGQTSTPDEPVVECTVDCDAGGQTDGGDGTIVADNMHDGENDIVLTISPDQNVDDGIGQAPDLPDTSDEDPIPDVPFDPNTTVAGNVTVHGFNVDRNERGILNNEGSRVGGTFVQAGFVGNCVSQHSDVISNPVDFAGFYPRGFIGNDCQSSQCLMNIVVCEFGNTNLGRFVNSISSLTGAGSLPSFTLDFGSWGSGGFDFNEPYYLQFFDLLRAVLLLVCFVGSVRILAG